MHSGLGTTQGALPGVGGTQEGSSLWATEAGAVIKSSLKPSDAFLGSFLVMKSEKSTCLAGVPPDGPQVQRQLCPKH